jgi:hypothetical protein
MTKAQKTVTAYLTIADTFLRKAMVAAGEAKMTLVTNDIRDSELYLDDALARVESYAKVASEKKSKKNLTSSR